MTAMVFRFTRLQMAAAGAAMLMLALIFQQTFGVLYANWHREEFSHGFLVPLVSVLLAWQRRDLFEQRSFRGSWAGVALAGFGLLVFFAGTMAAITVIDTYALVVVIAGCVLAVMGWEAFKLALVPVTLLFLMNPLPALLYNGLSSELQLLSSRLGVAVIRAFGISVFLEGNVIDLGNYKLQVAEACSGLRYLFPLMTLGVIVACVFKGRPWMRWCVFLSTIPITVLMNSLRIGVIGALVERYGSSQAEGFLHAFEGWTIFMACFALLFAEMWVLARMTGDRRSFRELFAFDLPASRPAAAISQSRRLGKPAVAVALLLLLAVLPARAIPQRIETRPARAHFAEFPLQIADWHGKRARLEQIYLDMLKMDDYLLADYVSAGAAAADGGLVNLYAAYYSSQRTGESAHSPRSCLPGGGWRFESFGPHTLPAIGPHGADLRVNRAVISQGSDRQLVYYWFQERGRNLTNEYLVKWYLFIDALTRNRSDGALVRLITPLAPNEEIVDADARLQRFGATLRPALTHYVPD